MTTIVGILNCTPDSFSDGDPHATEASLYDRALRLIDEGAAVIDLGGDSSRPGSQCVDLEEEWARIGGLIERIAHRVPISVDTHRAEIARRSLMSGARFINDIGGASDPEMIELVAASEAHYVFMYSASLIPHLFQEGPSTGEVIACINGWINERKSMLQAKGIPSERLIADSGMGAFVSSDPAVSLEILRCYDQLVAPRGGLMLGCSRKGFLRREGEQLSSERDPLSCLYAMLANAKLAGTGVPLYLRVHNVALQRACLEAWGEFSHG